MDLIGLMEGCGYILTVIDVFSKLGMSRVLKNKAQIW